jgi:hypothetical protein
MRKNVSQEGDQGVIFYSLSSPTSRHLGMACGPGNRGSRHLCPAQVSTKLTILSAKEEDLSQRGWLGQASHQGYDLWVLPLC